MTKMENPFQLIFRKTGVKLKFIQKHEIMKQAIAIESDFPSFMSSLTAMVIFIITSGCLKVIIDSAIIIVSDCATCDKHS
jgi:hypothetical protein